MADKEIMDERELEVLEDWTFPLVHRPSRMEGLGERSGVFLLKLPEWASEQLLAASEGAVVGSCEEVVIGNSVRKNFRFQISTCDSISEFSALASSATDPQHLSVFLANEGEVQALSCEGVFTALPVRDGAYKELVKSRAEKTEAEKLSKRKTVLDSRPLTEPATHNVQMFKYLSQDSRTQSALTTGTCARTAQKLRGPNGRGRSELKPEELAMSVLVAEDVGWNLNQFARRVREAGGFGVSLKDLKQILVDICDLVRRGDDAHPKYYLKSEFKQLSLQQLLISN